MAINIYVHITECNGTLISGDWIPKTRLLGQRHVTVVKVVAILITTIIIPTIRIRAPQ